MNYETRALIARQPMLYAGRDLNIGDRFDPLSNEDRDYLISRGRADLVPAAAPVAVQPPAPTPAPTPAPVAPAAAEAAAEPEAPAPTTRRRITRAAAETPDAA